MQSDAGLPEAATGIGERILPSNKFSRRIRGSNFFATPMSTPLTRALEAEFECKKQALEAEFKRRLAKCAMEAATPASTNGAAAEAEAAPEFAVKSAKPTKGGPKNTQKAKEIIQGFDCPGNIHIGTPCPEPAGEAVSSGMGIISQTTGTKVILCDTCVNAARTTTRKRNAEIKKQKKAAEKAAAAGPAKKKAAVSTPATPVPVAAPAEDDAGDDEDDDDEDVDAGVM